MAQTSASLSATSPTVAAPAKARAYEVGIAAGYRILLLKKPELIKHLDLYASMGLTWIRIDFDWRAIERVKGRYDWSSTDRVVKAAVARGIKVLPCIGFAPSWANGGGNGAVPPQRKHHKDYSRFAAAAAKRYAPQGIDMWQIWNEANLKDFWQPYPKPAKYARLLKSASKAIKRANPDAQVMATGMAPVGTTRKKGHVTALDFLKAMYAKGADEYFDAVSVHPYTYPRLPTDTSRWSAFQGARDLHRLMVRNGDGRKRVWLTEFGAPTGRATNSVSQARQARILTSGLALARSWSWTGPMMIYGGVDLGNDRSNREQNFGFVKVSLKPKRAYRAVVRELRSHGG